MEKQNPKGKDFYQETYDEMTKFETFFISHWKNIIYGAVGIVVVVSIVIVMRNHENSQTISLSGEIAKAQNTKELEQVVRDFASHPASDFAKLRLAQKYFDEKKYDDAFKIYVELAGFSKYPEISQIAKLDQAYVMEERGKNAEAAAKFAELAADSSMPQGMRLEAAYCAARNYSYLGKKEEALQALAGIDKFEKEKIDIFWLSKAERMKESLNQVCLTKIFHPSKSM